jgi:hypothetical protein
MRLGSPTLTRLDSTVRIEALLKSAAGSEALWYEFDARFADALDTTRLDGFTVAALMIAMERGERELVLEGPMSEKLFHNLTRQLAPILRLVVPELHSVSIRPGALDHSAPSANGVITGFSGGIDSFCTIADYANPSTWPGYRLTHLLFCNVGSNGRGAGGRRVFLERWQLIKDFAAEIGLEMIRVDSNLDSLIETRFERTHVLRNASVVLLLQRLVGKYLYSSTYRLQDCYIGAASDMAYADPATVHLLSTESLECISTGCQDSRVEKTRRAISVPQARHLLNVCVTPLDGTGRNCSRCFKCLRTLAALDLLGQLEAFEDVFDLSVYRGHGVRDAYLMMLPARTKDPFIRELLELARRPDIRLPRHVAAFHAAWPLLKIPYGWARALKHSVRRQEP